MDARDSATAPVPLARKAGSSATENHAAGAVRQNRSRAQGRIATVARIVFIVLALVLFAYAARSVVLPILMACVVSMMLKPPVRWLRACKVPTALAAALVVSIVVAALGFGAMRLGGPAVKWVQTAPEIMPRLKLKFQNILRPAARLSEAASSVGSLGSSGDTKKQAQPVEVKDNRITNALVSWTGSFLVGAGETVALVFLLLAGGDLFTHKLVRTMPTLRDKKQAVEISREIQQSVSRYLFSVGLINITFGIVMGFVFWLVGLPNPVLWGAVATFANFIPYFGPVLGIVAVALAGLLSYDMIGRSLLPAGAYCILHLVEANAITPFILGKRFTLNPVIILSALIFFSWLWGVMGALLAMPLLVTLKIVCEHVPALNMVAEFLSPADIPQSPEAAVNSHTRQTTMPHAT